MFVNITHSHFVFRFNIGSDIDLIYWACFTLSNFISYFFIAFLSSQIGFNNILYICLGMNIFVLPFLIFFNY